MAPDKAATDQLTLAIKTCTRCGSAGVCPTHQAELDALLPDRCPDPACYACAPTGRTAGR